VIAPIPLRKLSGETVGPSRAKRGSGVVIPISLGNRRQPSKAQDKPNGELITQARLAQILELHLEEIKLTQTLRELRMRLDADLSGGSEIESGELTFDRELQIVRRKSSGATAGSKAQI